MYKNLHNKRDSKKVPKEPFSNLNNQENIANPKLEIKNKNKYSLFSLKSLTILVIFSLLIFGITQFQNSNDNIINFDEINNVTNLVVVSNTTTSTTSTTSTIHSPTSTSPIPVTININNIEDAQKQLSNLGLYKGDNNGFNNSLTRNALKEFQKLAGLVVDGILGPKTKAALEIGENSYVSIDLKGKKVISDDEQVTKCGWSAFSGVEVQGIPIATYVNGQKVYREGDFFGEIKGKEVNIKPAS